MSYEFAGSLYATWDDAIIGALGALGALEDGTPGPEDAASLFEEITAPLAIGEALTVKTPEGDREITAEDIRAALDYTTTHHRVRVVRAHLAAAREIHGSDLAAEVRWLIQSPTSDLDLAPRKRDARFSIRLDATATAALERLAGESGLTASEILARAIEALASP